MTIELILLVFISVLALVLLAFSCMAWREGLPRPLALFLTASAVWCLIVALRGFDVYLWVNCC